MTADAPAVKKDCKAALDSFRTAPYRVSCSDRSLQLSSALLLRLSCAPDCPSKDEGCVVVMVLTVQIQEHIYLQLAALIDELDCSSRAPLSRADLDHSMVAQNLEADFTKHLESFESMLTDPDLHSLAVEDYLSTDDGK